MLNEQDIFWVPWRLQSNNPSLQYHASISGMLSHTSLFSPSLFPGWYWARCWALLRTKGVGGVWGCTVLMLSMTASSNEREKRAEMIKA